LLAYGLCARLGQEGRVRGEGAEVPDLLRRLQAIRVGTLQVAGQGVRRLLTQIPADLNAVLERLGLRHLFGQPPPWAPPGVARKTAAGAAFSKNLNDFPPRGLIGHGHGRLSKNAIVCVPAFQP
jgi:hypothetical protein